MIKAPRVNTDDNFWPDYWGMIGYVHWDDERVIEWAKTVGRLEIGKMGFLGKALMKDVFPDEVEAESSKVESDKDDGSQEESV